MQAQGKVHFSATLSPHRSLSPKGFMILMTIICSISFVAGLIFFIIGAWPVVGFLGLDVLAIYIAFKLNYRSGKQFETVQLIDDELIIERIKPSGKSDRWIFNPYWARVHIERRKERPNIMSLLSHGQNLVFGIFLDDQEKKEFANALNNALLEYKGGTRI